MDDKAQQPSTFVLLDGLRGIGALLVLIGHTLPYWGPIWAPSGAVVVDLFFLLSGFVLAFAYEPRFAAGMGAAKFMTHRIVRLYPLYLLGTVMGFVVLCAMALGDVDGPERTLSYTLQLLPQLVMLPAPEVLGNPDLYSLNPPAWTLFFELVVNLVYVAAFRWLRDTRILVGLLVLCAAALAACVFAFGKIDLGSDWLTFWGGFARASFGFFAGVLAYRLLGAPKTAERPARKRALLMLLALLSVCFIPASPELRPLVDVTLVVVFGIPMLMLAQSLAPPKPTQRFFLTLGRISYAVYILHQPFREIAERITWRSPVLLDTAPLGGLAIMAMAIVLAYVAERYYDRPVRRWFVSQLRQRARRQRVLAASAA